MARKTDIRLRRSNTEAAIPTHSNLSDGELAMNTKDGALYFKNSDNTIITVHDDSIMHIDSGSRDIKLFETVKRDSNNTAYVSGDASGFEYKQSVQIGGTSTKGEVALYRTIANGGSREVGSLITAHGTSYVKSFFTIGGAGSASATRLFIESPNINQFIQAKGKNNNASSDEILFTLDQVINSDTNTTSSGRIQLHTSTDGTQSTPISLNADGESYFTKGLNIGATAGSTGNTAELSVYNAAGAADIVEILSNNSNSSITTNQQLHKFKQRISTTTNTAVSGELEVVQVYEIAGNPTPVSRIRLSADEDEESYILGSFRTLEQIVTGGLTVGNMPLLANALGWVPAFGDDDVDRITYHASEEAVEFTPSGSATMGLVHRAFKVYAGQKIHITLPQKASGSTANGLTIKVFQHNGALPAGKTHVGDIAIGAYSSFVQDDDVQYTIVSNVGASSTWNNRTLEFTPTADGYASIGLYVTTGVGAAKIYVKQPKITNAGVGIGDVIAVQYLVG